MRRSAAPGKAPVRRREPFLRRGTHLVRTIEVPSAAAPNLAFGPDEAVLYVAAVDDTAEAPWYGKVYRIDNR